jgi:hypothetical protein
MPFSVTFAIAVGVCTIAIILTVLFYGCKKAVVIRQEYFE